MNDGAPTPLRFQKAGALVPDAFYLEREADLRIVDTLLAGQPCHVLASRQVGKSSLKTHTTQILRARGGRVASVDLSALGTESVTEDAWSYSLARSLYKSAGSRVDLSALWDDAARETPSARLDAALRALAAEDPARPLAVFLDEIDLLLAVPFPRANVLQMLRALLNARAEARELRGFTLCLIGVAVTTDLAPDLNHSPFVGRSIELRDFTREELCPLEVGLGDLGASPGALLDAVFAWTRGHPAFTQHLCAELVAQGALDEAPVSRVDALVRGLFLDAGRQQDQILVDVERRFAEKNERVPRMLSRYRAALAGEARDEGDDVVQEALRVAGLVRVEDDRLRPRNEIVAAVFDRVWVDARLSDRRFARALETWLDLKKSPSVLLRDEQLRDALAWAREQKELTGEERTFLDASQARATRQQRVVIGLLTAATVALGVGLGVSWDGRRRARVGEQHAQAEAQRARDAQRREGVQRREAVRQAERARTAEQEATREAERANANALAERQARQELLAAQPHLQELLTLRGRVAACDAAAIECRTRVEQSARGAVVCRTRGEQLARDFTDASATAARRAGERDACQHRQLVCIEELVQCRASLLTGHTPR